MSVAARPGARLLLPLHELTLVPVPVQPAPLSRVLALHRMVDLDQPPATSLTAWCAQVREAHEPCLAVDADGRVVALSVSGAALLGAEIHACLGVRLLDLVVMVDFTATGVPLLDPEMCTPPLRALRSRRLTRGLVRLRLTDGRTPTFDVVGVPLADGSGALGYFTEV